MLEINWRDVSVGGLFFAAGDSIGALLNNEFLYMRLVGMFVLGASLYAWEIPTYFNYLARCFAQENHANAIKRMLYSALFFNPLWIARHLLFIQFFSGQWGEISFASILGVATQSFIYCFPVSLIVNYLIQNVLVFRWRFFASSIFSALTAIYFAVLGVFFS